MAPVAFTPVGGSGPGSPWVRARSEIEEQINILGALLSEMVTKGDREAGELSYGERYTVGVRAAAQWSLGETRSAPLMGSSLPPTAGALESELALAEHLVTSCGPGHDLAAGVRAWLTWMTGEADRMVFMAL